MPTRRCRAEERKRGNRGEREKRGSVDSDWGLEEPHATGSEDADVQQLLQLLPPLLLRLPACVPLPVNFCHGIASLFQLASNPSRKRACMGTTGDLGYRILYVSNSQSEVSRSFLLSSSPLFHLSVWRRKVSSNNLWRGKSEGSAHCVGLSPG